MKPAGKRISEIIKILRKEHRRARTALYYETPFQIMVATILAAQCTDARVNKITPGLFKKYKTIRDFAKAKQAELEQEVRSMGFYRNKAKNIIAASKKIIRDFKGKVPDSMEELITLPGVARKTANIVLSSGFGKSEGIAVDTHVKRLSGRLGLSRHDDPDKIEQDLLKIVPKKDWLDFNYMLVNHGRKVCSARKPLCGECMLNKLCPSALKNA
ncbi:MAG: endonuclease III [Candidatus Omnitrophica bacterium]|nr:endonuclease III [Candidatus Omnitrophota bacterium]MBU1932464.1 endonuclease III [Candidatus Omnitrophota bacterium]